MAGRRIPPYRSPIGRFVVVTFSIHAGALSYEFVRHRDSNTSGNYFRLLQILSHSSMETSHRKFHLFGASEFIRDKRECDKSTMAFGTVSMPGFAGGAGSESKVADL